MKTYILEYIVYTRIIDGMLESEKNVGGLTAILKEG